MTSTYTARYAARELSEALKALDAAQAQIEAQDWWDGPPYSLEQDRDLAADRVVDVVHIIAGSGPCA